MKRHQALTLIFRFSPDPCHQKLSVLQLYAKELTVSSSLEHRYELLRQVDLTFPESFSYCRALPLFSPRSSPPTLELYINQKPVHEMRMATEEMIATRTPFPSKTSTWAYTGPPLPELGLPFKSRLELPTHGVLRHLTLNPGVFPLNALPPTYPSKDVSFHALFLENIPFTILQRLEAPPVASPQLLIANLSRAPITTPIPRRTTPLTIEHPTSLTPPPFTVPITLYNTPLTNP